MKQWTDNSNCRHYRFKDQYKKINSDFLEVSEDMMGEGLWVTVKDSYFKEIDSTVGGLMFPTVELSKKQAAKLAKLFEYFAVNGTLPVPKRQDVVEEEID